MAFEKIAFIGTDHEKICKAILGKEYREVNQYMDGRGGYSHREKHGHNKEAEKEIREKFGEEGVKAFIIHLLCDDIHKTYLEDKIIPEVKKRFDNILAGKEKPPYFEKKDDLYSQEDNAEQRVGADPNAKITAIIDKCKICGGTDNLTLVNMGAVCENCLQKRGVTICANCRKPVAISFTMSYDGRHTICKICNDSIPKNI